MRVGYFAGVVTLPQGFDSWAELALRMELVSVEGIAVAPSRAQTLTDGDLAVPFLCMARQQAGERTCGLTAVAECLDRFVGEVAELREVSPSRADERTLATLISLDTDTVRIDAKDLMPLRVARVRPVVGLERQRRIIEDVGLVAARVGRSLAVKSCNWVFMGPPGTGKTELATMLVDRFDELGVTNGRGNLVHAALDDVCGRYVGHTEAKIASLVRRARGGVLHIDEAHALASSGYGSEAVAALDDYLERYADEVICVLSGYGPQMERFLASESGLRSRFTYELRFEGYNDRELIEIFRGFVEEAGMGVDEGALDALSSSMDRIRSMAGFAYGRTMRNLFLASLPGCVRRGAQALDASDIVEGLASVADRDAMRTGFCV